MHAVSVLYMEMAITQHIAGCLPARQKRNILITWQHNIYTIISVYAHERSLVSSKNRNQRFKTLL